MYKEKIAQQNKKTVRSRTTVNAEQKRRTKKSADKSKADGH